MQRQQPHDCERCDGFARAGLANQAEDFSGGDGKTEVADRRERAFVLDIRRGKFDIQIADVEQRGHAVIVAGGMSKGTKAPI